MTKLLYMDITKRQLSVDHFMPNPGYILIDPFEKIEKSQYAATVDTTDRPHFGIIISIGDARIDEHGNTITCTNTVGQTVWYSIMGVEETKMKQGDDMRHRFVIVPFERIKGGWSE